MLITGGAGFVGINAASHFAQKGWKIHLLDRLSRRGANYNLSWLKSVAKFELHQTDIRNKTAVYKCVKKVRPDAILHLAAQVAVTTSVLDPREDFEINALGTFNLLEAVRNFSKGSFFINASTNKVYGGMEKVRVVERNGRYEYKTLRNGVGEDRILDFHSPYGCSKGTADQYTIDYSRIYGLRTASFRQSCIYGPHQFGVEDQGWVAWFVIAVCLGKKLTIYGDGKQIRDILHVRDLVNAYEAAIHHQRLANGQAFNIGGGPKNTMSLLELLSILEKFTGKKNKAGFGDRRPGDQPVFVCNIAKAKKLLEWEPRIKINQGISELISWVYQNKRLFK